MLVGDLNCDISKLSLDPHTRQLIFLCSLCQIGQLIVPTRVTDTCTSTTMIDLENIHASGVMHLGISDHSLINNVCGEEIYATKN